MHLLGTNAVKMRHINKLAHAYLMFCRSRVVWAESVLMPNTLPAPSRLLSSCLRSLTVFGIRLDVLDKAILSKGHFDGNLVGTNAHTQHYALRRRRFPMQQRNGARLSLPCWCLPLSLGQIWKMTELQARLQLHCRFYVKIYSS